MGYFSNGTEGLFYQERYCFAGADGNYCINFKDEDDGLGLGCPVWDMHIWFNENKEYAKICNHLIPRNRYAENCRCIWFDRKLDVTQDEAISMTLDDWKQLERGDIDVQPRFAFMS